MVGKLFQVELKHAICSCNNLLYAKKHHLVLYRECELIFFAIKNQKT